MLLAPAIYKASSRPVPRGRGRFGIACALTIVLLACLFMGEALLLDKMLAPLDIMMGSRPWSRTDNHIASPYNALPSDKVFYIHPIKVLVGRAWHTGLPLWEPHMLAGYPMIGNAQAGIFYPGTLPYILLPGADASDLVALFHLIIAGLGMFAYLRALSCRHLAALLGAIVFMLNGVLMVWLMWDSVAGAMVWLPWALWAFEMALRPGRFWMATVGAMAVALAYLGGHLQWSLYTVLAVALYGMFRLIYPHNSTRRRVLLTGLVIGVLGSTLASLQILPTLEYVGAGHRGNAPWEFIRQGYDWSSFLMLWVPKFFGEVLPPQYWGPVNYNEAMIYVGVAPMLLTIVAVVRRRGAWVAFFAGLGLFAALCAAQTDAYRLLHWLPGFDSLPPVRMRYLVVVSLSVLCALGMDWLLRETTRRGARAAAGVGLVPIGFGVAYLVARSGKLPVEPRQWEYLYRQEAFFVVVLMTSAGLLLLGAASKTWGRFALAGLCALTLVDLWISGVTYQRPVSTQYYYPLTPGIQMLQDDRDLFRIVTTRGVDWSTWSLRPDTASLFGLNDVGGYDSVYPRRYAEFMQRIAKSGPAFVAGGYLSPNHFDSPLIDLLNVKYALAYDRPVVPGWEVVHRGDLRIYRRTDPLPRAWIASQAQVIQDDSASLDRLTQPDFDPRQTVILEQAPVEPLGTQSPRPAGTVRLERYENTRIVLDAAMQRDGWLVLSEIFYPGWQVRIDDVPANLYRANYVFRAVPVPTGEHRVELNFMPASFVIGAVISAGSGLLLLAIVVISRRVEQKGGLFG